MNYSIKNINQEYDFEIVGTSFAGQPVDGTMLFITKKVRGLAKNLVGHKDCLIYAETGLELDESISKDNCVVFCENPQAEYGKMAVILSDIEKEVNKNRQYQLMNGYYIGENVTLGKNVCIEPGCMIDHDVVIGDNACIGFGSVIRNAVIGNDFRCYEHAIIGTDCFFMAELDGEEFRIPSFGKVVIGNRVDVGANVVIERGFNRDTIIKDGVKLDSNVSIGHDDILGNHVNITCGATLAGLVTVGDNTYIGMNATVKQRLTIGENALVGMGSAVISNVKADTKVFGNPAKKMAM